MKKLETMTDLDAELRRLCFHQVRTQDGLGGLKVVWYAKGGIILEVYEWSESDWDVKQAYGPENELQNIQPVLLELTQQTPVRQQRMAFIIGKPREASDV